MTAAEWNIGLDVNRDGWFAENTVATDPINIIYYGASQKDQRTLAAGVGDALIRSDPQRNFPYGLYYYLFSADGVGSDFFYFGFDGVVSTIDCLPSTEYTAVLWFQGVDNYAADEIEWFVTYGSGSSSTVTAAFTADYVQSSVTFTTGPADTRMHFRVEHVDAAPVVFNVTGFMVVPGAVAPTNFNAGGGSDAHENIMDYVVSANWTNGMPSAYEEFAGGNKMTIILDNQDGRFSQDYVTGDQLAANGSFDSWTGGVPTGWTEDIVTTGGGDLTEVGTGEGFGGTGTDAVNFSHDDIAGLSVIRLSTSNLAAGNRYKVTIVCSYNNNPANFFQIYHDDNPVSIKFGEVGTKVFYFTAPPPNGPFVILAYISALTSGVSSLTIDSVSADVATRYAGIERGSLVWVRASFGGTDYPLCTMRVDNINPNIGLFTQPMVALECIDSMPELAAAEYIPYFAQDQTLPTIISNVLDRTNFTYPYINGFWILGVEGASRLEEETYLFSSSDAFTGNGLTVLDFIGDIASSNDNGISAQAVTRDTVASELGGCFFWNARNAIFQLVSRHEHAQNLGASAGLSFTDDMIDEVDYRYSDDVINSIKVNYTQRVLEDTTEVLWSSSEDIIMQPDQTRTITGRYRDPDVDAVKISAYSTEPIVSGVDYTVDPPARSFRIHVSVVADSQSATFQITNTAQSQDSQPITVQGLQIRGKRIRNHDRQFVEALNAPSMFMRDKRESAANIPVISNSEDVQNYALSMVERFGDPITRFESITWTANKDDTRMTRALQDLTGSPITITTTNNHNRRYIVVGERYELTAGGEHTLKATRILKPTERAAFWYLGAVGYSELGSTTLPAF